MTSKEIRDLSPVEITTKLRETREQLLQLKLRKQTGKDYAMPILHLSQLIGVAAGLEASELQFKRHVMSVEPVVQKLEA